MFSVGKTSKHLSSVTKSEIRRRFATQSISISRETPKGENISEINGFIQIFDIPTAVQMLNDYGHLIKNLEITNMLEWESTETLYDVVKKQCTEKLIGLRLKYLERCFLKNIQTPFENVESFSWIFEIGPDVDIGSDMTLSDLFPKLRILELSYIALRNVDKVLVDYPHLEYLDIEINESELLSRSSVAKLLRKNRQIRSLSIRKATGSFLETIANELPKLERLELRGYLDENHNYAPFKQLKRLRVNDCFVGNLPIRFNFGNNLEELEVEPYIDLNSEYIKILENNQNVKKFRTIHDYELKDEHITRLAAAGSNLVEMLIVLNDQISDERIVKLIQSSGHLERLHIQKRSEVVSEQTKAILHQYFDADWTINVIGTHIYLGKK